MGALLDELKARNKQKEPKTLGLREEIVIRKDSVNYNELIATNQSAVDTINRYQETMKKDGYMSAEDLAAYKSAVDTYTDTGNRMRSVAKYLGVSYNDEDENAWQSSLSMLGSNYDSAYQHYSKFKTEDAYDQYNAQVKDTTEKLGADQDALRQQIAQMKTSLDALYTEWDNAKKSAQESTDPTEPGNGAWSDYETATSALEKDIADKEAYLDDVIRLQGIASFGSVADPESENYDPEFAEKSKYIPQAKTERSAIADALDDYSEDPWEDPLYEAINGNTEAQDYLKNKDASMAGQDSPLASIFFRVAEGKNEALQMDEDEKRLYNYYANHVSHEKAMEYYDLLEADLNARQRISDAKYWKQQAQEDPVGTSVFSIVTSPLKGLSYVGQLADYLADGKIDENAGYNKFSYMHSDIRGEVSRQIEQTGWGNVGSWGYNLGMGMGDFLMSTAVGGGNQWATLAIMSTGAAADTTLDAKARGLNDDQAIALGTIAGAAEVITEKIGLDALFDTALRGKSPLTYVLKNVFSEGLEEPTSSLINFAADIIISKDKSQWRTSINEYMQNGCSENEAFWKAFTDQAASLGLDALGGGISGGFMGGGSVALGSVSQALAYTKDGNAILQSGGVTELQELAKGLSSIDPNIAKIAGKVTNASTRGNARQVGKLYGAVSEVVGKQNGVDLAQKLTEKGVEAKTARKIAEVILSAQTGSELSRQETELLESLAKDSRIQEAVAEVFNDESSAAYQRNKKLQAVTAKKNVERIATPAAQARNDGEVYTAQGTENGDVDSMEGKTFQKSTGKVTQNVKFSSIKDGKATVELEDGSVVAAEDISFGNEGDNLVFHSLAGVEGMSAPAANAIWQVYKHSSNKASAGAFGMAAIMTFRAGYLGDATILKANDTRAAALTAQQRELIYREGGNAAQAQAEADQANVDVVYEQAKHVLNQKEQAGKKEYRAVTAKGISVKKMNKSQKASFQMAEQIAPAVKSNIVVYDGGTEWGHYDPAKDEVCLNVNAKWNRASMMAYTLAHELAHRAKKGSPAKFKAFADFLIQKYGEQGSSVDAMIAEQLNAAKGHGIEMTEDEAFEEVVADACQRMLLDTDAGKKLAEFGAQSEQNRSFLKDLAKWINELVDKLRNLFKDVEPDSLAAKEFAKLDANAKQILADMFVDMSLDAGEKLSTIKAAGLTEKITTGEGGVKMKNGNAYDYSKSFAEQIDDYKAGKIPKGDTLIVGGTPEVFRKIGMIALPMTINTTHIDYALNGTKDFDHHLGEALLKQLPEAIKKPVAIMTSGTKANSSIVAMLEIRHNGKQVIVPIVVDGFGRQNGIHIDSNAVTSVYGKNYSISKALHDAIVEETNGQFRLYYLDKNKATALLQKARVPMPKSSATLNGGFIHSIRESGSPVNMKFQDVTETQQFKRWFGDWMKHPNKASKIVNADGTPMVVYHGTNAEFNAFDKRRAKVGVFGKGFYFAPSKGKARAYGRLKVLETYLAVRTPYVVQDSMGFTADDYRNMQKQFGIQDKITDHNVAKILQQQGYDGIIAEDGNGQIWEVVAFESAQIKSATDNIGTFDGSNPDIRYKLPVGKTIQGNNPIDNSELFGENGITDNPTRGGQYDNRGVREGTAEGTEVPRFYRGTNSANGGESYQGQGWENRSYQVQKKARKAVENHVNHSHNADEIYYYLLDVLEIDDADMTAELYDEAIEQLTKRIYNDAINLHPVLFEDKWKFMGGSVSGLRRSILDSVRENLYKLPVGEDTSPRALLANVLESVAQNDMERDMLRQYQQKAADLDEQEQKLKELKSQIKDLSFAKGPSDTAKLKELQLEAQKTANRINIMDKQLLRIEAFKPLQNLVDREKTAVIKRAEQKSKAAAEAYRTEYRKKLEDQQKAISQRYQESRKKAVSKVRETAEKQAARKKLQKLVIDTAKWIAHPAKTDIKCPDLLKKPYSDFLNSIDMSSKRLAKGGDPTKNDLRLTNAMNGLATALEKIVAGQDPDQEMAEVFDSGYLDLPADFVEQLRDMATKITEMMVEGDYVVNSMTAAEVRQLSQMIRTLNHAIKTMSTLYANLRFSSIEALGVDTMEFLNALGEIEKSGGIKDFALWENGLPYYVFKRFGAGGESVFEGLMDGQDKLAFHAKRLFAFQEKTWTAKEAKEWSEDVHTIVLPSGNKLTLTTADAMSIYCLSRREQGLQHLLGGGTRVKGLQKGSQKAKDSRSRLTIEDVNAINASLTVRQKEVANAIQRFMSTVCAEWGNEISMKRFLTKDFTEEFYFPIESNDENMTMRDPAKQQSDLFRLLNISATKPITPKANNEVIIRNIFDVFTGHASDMARLNAFGMPLLDYMKWLNYRQKSVNDAGQVNVVGVRKSMQSTYGDAAGKYVLNLIKDVNGRASDGGLPGFYKKMLQNAKTAMVGNNLRVATLQITSYPRAGLVLSQKSLALGLSKKPNIRRAQRYCGIALWKSFGFYDTDIARSMEDQIKGTANIRQKMIELSLKGAELGDAITWGALWNACEYEVAGEKKIEVGTEAFYQAVAKKLREVVYRTQVVDSMLTRSEAMRSKNAKMKELTSFMSEPTVSANILMDAGFTFSMEKRRTGSAKAAWKKTGGYFARAIAVYSTGQLAAALVEALWDTIRSDEDDEEKWEIYLKALGENLVLDLLPFNKIPIVAEFAEAAMSLTGLGYYSTDSIASTGLTQAISAFTAWSKFFNGKASDDPSVYKAIYKTMQALSSMTGIAGASGMRDLVALWNFVIGSVDEDLKIE